MRLIREAVILAGGFGTRLAHVVPDVCKPMAPVAGHPFLKYILDQLADARIEHVVIADGYRREQIESCFGDGYKGMDITYSSETTPLLTGGAVKKAMSMCAGEWVYVFNGDTWFDVDISNLECAALKADAETKALIAVKRMRKFDRYGTVEFDECGYIYSFKEKRHSECGLINGGVYVMRRDALDDMPDKFSLENDYFKKVVSEAGTRLQAVECLGSFIDIGVPEDYERAQEMLASKAGNCKLAMFDRDGTINIDVGHLHEIEKLKLIEDTLEIMKSYSDDPDWRLVVITNQAGIAKGLYTETEMRTLHRFMDEIFAERGIKVSAWYFCPHHPEFTGDCSCRKPAPGMLLKAIREFGANPDESVMYGDKDIDREAARCAGVRFVKIGQSS